MSFKELQNFLKELNIQVDDSYARKIFKVRKRGSVGWVCLAVCLEHSLEPALSPAYLTSWLCRNVTTLRQTPWRMRRLRPSTRY